MTKLVVDLKNSFFNLSENVYFIESCANILRDTPSQTQPSSFLRCILKLTLWRLYLIALLAGSPVGFIENVCIYLMAAMHCLGLNLPSLISVYTWRIFVKKGFS